MKKVSLFLTLIMTIGFVQTGFAVETPFPDVDADNLAFDAIEYLKDKGVLEGYPDGTYKPGDEINRAEFTKIVMGPIITDMTKKNCFPDVGEDWFAPYVCDAKDRNIIAGYPDGTFKPAEPINFSEASKIIANAYGVEQGEADADATRWYKTYVSGLESKNVIPLTVEYFDENITRDEMAEMIYRLDAEVTDKATRTYDEIYGQGFVQVESCAQLQERYDLYNYRDMYYYADDVLVFDQAEEGAMETEAVSAPDGVMSESKSAESPRTGGGGADEYSTTNIQVEGVDEADVIKNDGRYIYLIKGETVRIIDAYPAESMEELISFSLGEGYESFTPSEMYVDEDTLVVIGSVYKNVTFEPETTDEFFYPSYYYSTRTKVYVVDITDRAKPAVQRAVEFDGGYNTSRRIGNTLYMVMTDAPYYYYGDREIMPLMYDSEKGMEEPVAGCTDVRILPKPQSFNFLITAAIPLKDMDKPVDREVIAGDAQNVYASAGNLFVTATDWGGGYYRSYNAYDSAVYKFALGNGTIAYKAQGKVPGTILNQFSMDEYNGNFRVATTTNEYVMGKEMANNLYILDKDLKLLGELEGIAPGEKIYSVRFMGDRAYMVTFDRIDPLFVIDVATPSAPKILGELKIPGYSTYLHPYDENHLLGFGNEVDENNEMSTDDFVWYEAVQGMKIGMFDVTDVSKPKEMFKEVIGDQGTYSELLYNHKALLFDKEKELLAFPITVYELEDTAICSEYNYDTCPSDCRKICVPSSCTFENGITVCTTDCNGTDSCVPYDYNYSNPVFDGAYVYNVNLEDGFTLKGKITHYNEDQQQELLDNKYTDYERAIKRLLYMGETLYSVSFDALKANKLSDLSEINMIELAGNVYDVYYGSFWE